MAGENPLYMPRTAIAIAIASIPVGILVPVLLPSLVPAVVAGCYVIFVLLCWLCWAELREIYLRLFRPNLGTRGKIPGDFWAVAIPAVIVFVLGTALWIVGVPGAHADGTSITINGTGGECVNYGKNYGTITCNPALPRQNNKLYQDGLPVATVTDAAIDPNSHHIVFRQIYNSRDLDYAKPVEFQNWLLRIEKANTAGRTLMGIVDGKMADNIVPDVECEIVSNR